MSNVGIEFSKQLGKHFWLKYHLAIILSITIISGVLSNFCLLDLGINKIVVRYPLTIIISYLVFLALLRIWLWYIARNFSPRLNPLRIKKSKQDESKGTADSSTWYIELLEMFMPSEAALFPIAVVIFIFILVGITLWSWVAILYQAPIILSEIALHFFLAAGIIRSAKKIDHPHWVGSVFKSTSKPMLLLLTIVCGLGLLAEFFCPFATSLPAIVNSCF